MRKTLWVIAALFVFAVMGSTVARADTATYAFTITGNGFTSTGTISVSTTGTPGVDDVNSIMGNFSSTAGGFAGAIGGLIPGSYNSSSQTEFSLPAGAYEYFDNLYYPTGAAPSVSGAPAGGLLDQGGIAFTVGSYWVNLFGYGPGVFDVSDGLITSSGPYTLDDDYVPVTATFSQVPEPGTSSLALIGLAMLGFVAVIRKRKVQGLAQAA
jgi:hypothetical protein